MRLTARLAEVRCAAWPGSWTTGVKSPSKKCTNRAISSRSASPCPRSRSGIPAEHPPQERGDGLGLERLGEVEVRAFAHGAGDLGVFAEGGEHDDGDMTQRRVRLEGAQHLDAA